MPHAPSKNEVAQRWQKKVGEFDAFIFTAAEYNRGPTAVLKNALDYAYADGADPQRHSLMVDRQQATNWRVCHALCLEDSQYQQRRRDGFAGDIAVCRNKNAGPETATA